MNRTWLSLINLRVVLSHCRGESRDRNRFRKMVQYRETQQALSNGPYRFSKLRHHHYGISYYEIRVEEITIYDRDGSARYDFKKHSNFKITEFEFLEYKHKANLYIPSFHFRSNQSYLRKRKHHLEFSQ